MPSTCSSGVTLDDKAVRLFEEMKMKKLHSYFVYHIEDNKVVKVLSRGFPDGDSYYNPEEPTKLLRHEEMVKELRGANNGGHARYAAFDFNFLLDGSQRRKLLFFSWAGDKACVKDKMIYAASKAGLKNALGADIAIQASDEDDLSLSEIYEK
ncbi:COF1 [Bugula neritina]|uniref:COF1 n=1 Tax=Bugula neritina TaxID=10212 RepID=A0A7J7K7L3_BUGNE|nr:COF1 [Bugula neritina]